MKKRFIFFAALAVVLAIAVTPANAAKPLKIIKGPYLQQLTPDSIVIMWETNTAADSWVDYGGPSPVGNSTPVKIHEVLLDGLAADTVYQYTVTSGTATSEPSIFATAPDGPRNFRFVAYGDTRSQPREHTAVIQAIIASGPEIVIHTGDLVENGDEYNQWGRQFFDPAYALMIDTPLLPIIGNHEGSGNLFRDFFSLGDNDDWFAFTYGGVRFIGLNTHNRSYSPGSAQYNWLEAELQSPECTSADWQIVYFHHPPYTATENHSDEMNVQTYLVPLFELYGVDMVFNGHSHAYERYFHNGIYYIVTGGGGAPLRNVITDTKEPIREFGESVYHHCVIDVDVENSRLIFEARYNDGTVLDGPITIQEPVDVTPPTASLLAPLDNGPDDLDADDGEVTVNTTQSSFQIQLSDVGDGIDDATVTSTTVTLTKEGGVDYTFGYDAGLDVITLTPTGGDFGNGLYVITLSETAKIKDLMGNEMEATTLSVEIDTSIVPPVTLIFQQGVDGYSAMVDTMIRYSHPDDNFADSATQYDQEAYKYQLNADTDSLGGPSQVLLRFDDIIGPSQIPSGSTIISATLRIRSTDDGNGGKLHRILQAWVDTVVTWNNSFGADGIQADGSEAAVVEDDGVPQNNPDTDVDLDVTATLQDWADGVVVNNGWAILPNGTNGWHMAAAEHPTLDYRPELIVTFITTGSRPPVAADDAYGVDEDNTLSVDAPGVLANDTDPEEDLLTAVLVDDVSNGTLALNDDGSFGYTPNANFNGTDSFTYRANDGIWNSNVATVTITVNPVEDAPVANDDSASTMESMPVTIDVLANDTDVDGDDLTVTNLTQPTNGTVVNNGTDVTYTPNAGHTGEDSFTYTANDGTSDSDAATVTVTTLELSLPGQATEPAPPEGQTRVNRNTVILSWLAGADAASHDVYLGTDPAALPLVSAGQSETTYDPPAALGRKTMYYWRIDEVNAAGTTPGVVWSFTTN